MNLQPQGVYVFQILFQRVITEDQGQDLIQQIWDKTKASPHGTTWQVIKLQGVNRFGNPFPKWLADILIQAGCDFDDINMVYQLRCDKRRAYQLREWFENYVRPWAVRDPAWTAYMQSINSRLLDASAETALTYESF
jgi:hypothetical protein